jgi:hypothetical protein
MPKLSLIESEATRLLRRVPEASRHALQQELLELCEAHWPELRGPEPATRLAHALWSVAPPCADLLADLVAANDARLQGLLGTQPAHAFALLALAEIERGNVEGVRLAHAPMMLFDTPAAGARYAEAVAAALRGGGADLHAHPHASRPPLWKALAAMVAGSGRCDLAAAMGVIGVLLARPAADAPPDAALDALRGQLDAIGVHFLGIDDGHVSLAVHGESQPPVTTRQLAEMLGEIRQAWLA